MKWSVGTGHRTPHVAFNPNVAETTTLFVLTRSVLFLITVINSIGVDNKAEITYLGFRSDFLKCWGGCSNWSRRKKNINRLGRGTAGTDSMLSANQEGKEELVASCQSLGPYPYAN